MGARHATVGFRAGVGYVVDEALAGRVGLIAFHEPRYREQLRLAVLAEGHRRGYLLSTRGRGPQGLLEVWLWG